jgi:hypothetical protein
LKQSDTPRKHRTGYASDQHTPDTPHGISSGQQQTNTKASKQHCTAEKLVDSNIVKENEPQ